MKIVLTGLLLLLISCQNNENNTIIGSWQLTESEHGTGAEIITSKVDSEIILKFENNGNYTEYTNGKQISDRYLITETNILVLISSKTKDSVYYSYRFDGSKLIMDEVDYKGSFICDEGCSSVYKKIKD